MAVYHFCFDLRVFGWQPDWNFYRDPFWTWQRVGILSSFLFCAGLGQGIASAQGQSWARFWRRWWQIAAGALLVSISTYVAFGQRFVSFGVLHGMAVMLILVRLAAPRSRAWPLAVLGLLAIAAGYLYQQQAQVGWHLPAAFDSRWLNWLGLVSHKPATEDFVPLLPWLGVMLLGAAAGQRLQAGSLSRFSGWTAPKALGPLLWLGQHSLGFYLLHQPIFWGLLSAAAYLGLQP